MLYFDFFMFSISKYLYLIFEFHFFFPYVSKGSWLEFLVVSFCCTLPPTLIADDIELAPKCPTTRYLIGILASIMALSNLPKTAFSLFCVSWSFARSSASILSKSSASCSNYCISLLCITIRESTSRLAFFLFCSRNSFFFWAPYSSCYLINSFLS